MFEPRNLAKKLAADSFAEIAMAEHITALAARCAFNCRRTCGNSGPVQEQRLEGTREQTGRLMLSVDASSAPVKTFCFFLVTKRTDIPFIKPAIHRVQAPVQKAPTALPELLNSFDIGSSQKKLQRGYT